MNTKDKEFYDIVLKNCTEKEIYAILLKKKEIDDITPKLRTLDDNKMLKCLFNKMRKYSKDLIADIKKKCPLERAPKVLAPSLFNFCFKLSVIHNVMFENIF